MTRQNRSGIFEPHLAFEHADAQIPQSGQEPHDKAQDGSVCNAERGIFRQTHSPVKQKKQRQAQSRKEDAGQITFPAFLGAEARGHLVSPKAGTQEVGRRIGYPDSGQSSI